ncbi:hypothetical protein Ahy_B08g089458 [Arachis hypogaea]|uniref:Aminotransferase-like plant mobile domain-containing protein n=1 Tax=Arachis hypogaea TaxID=3818 RepID=A0A444XXY0_ARAHY|nr:hypothetical protein Ahy_B08g089458 [Arachis hypogaea]
MPRKRRENDKEEKRNNEKEKRLTTSELPPQNKVKRYTVHFTWFHERFRVLPDDATEEIARIYARTFIMMLLSTQLFGDKSENRVHIRWLPFVARLDDMASGRGDTTPIPSHWHPGGPPTCQHPITKEERVIQCRLALDRLGDRDIVWEPYTSLDVIAVVHPEILTEEHSRPSVDFLRWWYKVVHRFLSPDSLIADPRIEGISQDVVQRGSSQVPSRVPMPDMPDNRRVEQQRRIGTRATDREWRWLDDMIQDDRFGGDGVGHADHRVRCGRPQCQGGTSGSHLVFLVTDPLSRQGRGPRRSHPERRPSAFSAPYPIGSGAGNSAPDGRCTGVSLRYGGYAAVPVPHVQSHMSDPQGYQPQFHVDLNEPAISPYDSWLGMGGTPPSAFGVACPSILEHSSARGQPE